MYYANLTNMKSWFYIVTYAYKVKKNIVSVSNWPEAIKVNCLFFLMENFSIESL